MSVKLSICAAELPTLLDRAPPGVRILSLDCFDTLIWRNVHAPRDVFAEGSGIWMRMRAESRARGLAAFDRHQGEVRIEEIYRSLMPSAQDGEIAAAVERELHAEARHCYAFAPTVALMRAARARGLKVIIVSDTYLSEAQLRDLIRRAGGTEVEQLIDHVFPSCQYGACKGAGLFEPVLAALGVGPGTLFHVGDNKDADQVAPARLGIATARLRQFDGDAAQRLRFEAAAAAMIDPSVRVSAPVYQPHRPAVSLRRESDAAWALGHDVLGPVMHAFAQWVRAERDAMATRIGKPVRLLFLLRDGHLPQRVYEELFGASDGAAVELSRFTARRAGFTGAAAIRTYLAGQASHGRIEILARQLGLSGEEGLKLARGKDGRSSQAAFNRAALLPHSVRKIAERSARAADKVMAHLRRAGVSEGDAVMFVDLGYNGSVQTHVDRVLQERFGLTVAGRYLLLREEEETGLDKAGLLDRRHYDVAALHALCGPIAVVEQLCTIAQGSVVDYTLAGEPLRKAPSQKGLQNAVRDRVQDGCVAFARAADGGAVRPAASDDADCRRRAAAACLARFLFMPIASEVEVLQAFDHDVNLGTEDVVPLIDTDAARRGLRQRGLFYLNGSERMYLPGELQAHGLPQMLAMLAANRHDLDLRAADFRAGTITLPGFVADAVSQTAVPIEAHATHDGYYLATVPVGAGRFAVGLQVGAIAKWLQVEEAAFYPVAAFHGGAGETGRPAQILCDGMEEEAPGFYRCGEDGLILVPPPPPPMKDIQMMLLAFVFRPVIRRAERQALAEAA